MKRVILALAIAVGLCACGEAKQLDQDAHQLQQQQDALSASIKKIQVYSKASPKAHPDFTQLGQVQGYCFNIPNSTSGQVVHGDGLKAAAYRKYGDQVDAIVSTTIWFVSDDDSAVAEPYTENGYFECAGTAVHYNALAEK